MTEVVFARNGLGSREHPDKRIGLNQKNGVSNLADGSISARVTVGVVVKDSEETVRETIKSISAQTYPHELMETIVVDGGSKDKTLSIIDRAAATADIPLRIYSDGGKGLGCGRQIVVDNAQGDYVIWVDSDATIPERYVSSLVEFIGHHPRHGGARGMQEASNQTGLLNRLESLSLVLRRSPRHVFDTNGQIFRVQAIRQVGGFDVRIKRAGEDVDLILRMMKSGWLFSVIQVKFDHRIGSWNQIWRKRVRDGYGFHYRLHKHSVVRPLLYQVFPILFLVGVKDSVSAYRLTRQKASFLLPFWYCLRSIPWCIGLGKSQIDGHSHT